MHIEKVIDKWILKASSENDFNNLDDFQQSISALEILIGTCIRSGLQIFFENQNEYLFQAALKGFKQIKATDCGSLLAEILASIKYGKPDQEIVKKLSDKISTKDFEFIYTKVRTEVENYLNKEK